MRRTLRRLSAAAVGVVLGCGVSLGQGATDIPAAAQHAFDEGAKYEQAQSLPAAMDSYRAAIKAAGGHCVGCMEALARVQMKLEAYKDSAATDAAMLREVPGAPARAQVEYHEGLALFALYFAQSEGRGGIDKDAKKAAATLKQADDVLVQGERDDAANEPLRMLHGRVLAALKRDEDAGREFQACAAAPGASAEECARAQHFERDVALARNEPAPIFAAKTLDGKTVSLDSLAGKVVVMDFWATWCPVCVRDSDYVQSLMDSFGDDKRFVLLEVSGDENDQVWRNYVKQHELQGLQVRDAGSGVSDAFHVGAFPTYVILDGNGSVRMRVVGSRGDLRGTVRDLLKEATPSPDPPRTLLPKAGQ